MGDEDYGNDDADDGGSSNTGDRITKHDEVVRNESEEGKKSEAAAVASKKRERQDSYVHQATDPAPRALIPMRLNLYIYSLYAFRYVKKYEDYDDGLELQPLSSVTPEQIATRLYR